MIIATVFTISTISVDNLIANYFPPTVNREVDYVYISNLSTDAVEGWERAYEYTKVIIDSLPSDTALSPDQIRHLVYSREVLLRLIKNINYYEKIARLDLNERFMNIGDFLAAPQLIRIVEPKELLEYIEKSDLFCNFDSNLYQSFLDRTLEYPLVW